LWPTLEVELNGTVCDVQVTDCGLLSQIDIHRPFHQLLWELSDNDHSTRHRWESSQVISMSHELSLSISRHHDDQNQPRRRMRGISDGQAHYRAGGVLGIRLGYIKSISMTFLAVIDLSAGPCFLAERAGHSALTAIGVPSYTTSKERPHGSRR
jgi:hypothetical protein